MQLASRDIFAIENMMHLVSHLSFFAEVVAILSFFYHVDVLSLKIKLENFDRACHPF